MLMRHLLLLPATLLVLAVAGCYDTQREVFGPEEAVAVPGLDGTYVCTNDKGACGLFTVFWAQSERNYRIIAQSPPNPHQSFGVFRVIPLATNLYVVQLRYESDAPNYDGPDVFAQTFFRVKRSKGAIAALEELLPERDQAMAIVQGYAIDVWEQHKKAQGLSGERTALNRFLRSLRAVSFKVVATYSRVRQDNG